MSEKSVRAFKEIPLSPNIPLALFPNEVDIVLAYGTSW